MKVTVSGNIGDYKIGQVLEDEKEIIAYYRTLLNEGADKISKLTDEQILEGYKKFEGDGEDAEVQRVEYLENF